MSLMLMKRRSWLAKGKRTPWPLGAFWLSDLQGMTITMVVVW
jgi:hypothetical protein